MIKKVKKGFTLIELVVVIAVIAILSAVSVVAYVGITNSAKKSVAEQEANTVKTLLRTELTRGDYTYSPAEGSVVFSLNGEKVEYKVTSPATFAAGLDELLCIAQGKKAADADTDAYITSGTVSEGKFLVAIEDSNLVLKHANGQQATVFAVEAK